MVVAASGSSEWPVKIAIRTPKDLARQPPAQEQARLGGNFPPPSGSSLIFGQMSLTVAFALASGPSAFIGAAIPATIAGVIAIYLNQAGRIREDRERRRDIYSNAYKRGLEWCEAVYRVRRRASDGSGDRQIVERLHELQEDLAYYQGLLRTEDEELGRAYETFLRRVMGECEPLLQQAWRQTGREPTEPKPANEVAPKLEEAKKQFLDAVRLHQLPWWKKV